jgi:hypothetical protein
MADMPPARQEYTVDEIKAKGKKELFVAFENAYRLWLKVKILNWKELRRSVLHTIPSEAFLYIEDKIIPELVESPNFNLYKGDLERACAAAKHLAPRYDIGMGIAKKGLWTSFVFNLYGLESSDSMIIRNGEQRVAVPLGMATRTNMLGKRMLLFDNDAVTGLTIKSAAKHLKIARPKCVDALLNYACTELKPEYYNEMKSQFKNRPTVLGERDGVIVIDTRSEVKPHVRKLMTLQTDYEPRPELLSGLAGKLGVYYEPKA